MNLIQHLKNSFIADGVRVNEPATLDEVRAFETKYDIKLPTILVDYFTLFNGTGQGNFGTTGFAFFSLAEVKLVSEELTHDEPDKNAHPNGFVFADYLLWCWGYAVKLSKGGSDGAVYEVAGSTLPPRKIANSFAEFVHLYLTNHEVLL